MKKLTHRYRRWMSHRRRRTNRREQERQTAQVVTIVGQFGARKVRASTSAREMPSCFCLTENFEESSQFLARLRSRFTVFARGRRQYPKAGGLPNVGRYIKFETIEKISPSAALILAAEYDRARIRADKPLFVVDIDEWRADVVVLLYDLGFFKLLEITKKPPHKDPNADLYVLPMRSGKVHDPEEVGGLMIALAELFERLGVDDGGQMLHLYGVLGEAMENVVHHAYPADHHFQVRHVGRWWMTGAVTRSTRRLTASMFDQGVSVPRSLPNWQRYGGYVELIKKKLGFVPEPNDLSYDGEAIFAALNEAASSTNEVNRGKGLALMTRFIDGCHDGQLRILSRAGEVIYRKGQPAIVRNHTISIGGTLIEIDVVL